MINFKLKKEFEWYVKNHSELFKKYPHKVLLIQYKSSCTRIIKVCDSEKEAEQKVRKLNQLGEILIQPCEEKLPEERFHSRVHF